MALSILTIAHLNSFIVFMNVSNLNYRSLLCFLDRIHLNNVSIVVKENLVSGIRSVEFSNDFEFRASRERTQSFPSISDGPFFISLVLVSLNVATAQVFEFRLWDAKAIINYIKAHGSFLD